MQNGCNPKRRCQTSGLKRTRCFRTRGKKGERHDDPDDPPRRRANKRRGHGTYDNDRPPIAGTFGRESGQVRLRVVHHTDKETLVHHVHTFTKADAVVFTDEWQSYNHIIRLHSTVCHSEKEWARDDDGDGICEVHINTAEGMWTTVRNFLRSFLLLLLLIIFLFTFGRSGPETFAYVFLAEDLDAGNDLIGLLGALTWLAALPGYYVADWLFRCWGSVVTMAISFGLYIFGWSGYALIPHPILALPLVALEGFGQALYLVSMVILLGELSLPERVATDQMLAQLTVPGLASMIAQPVSGWLFDRLGGRSLFAFDAIVVLLTTGLLLARANWLETASLSHRQQRKPK